MKFEGCRYLFAALSERFEPCCITRGVSEFTELLLASVSQRFDRSSLLAANILPHTVGAGGAEVVKVENKWFLNVATPKEMSWTRRS